MDVQNRPDVTDDQVTGEEQREQGKSEQNKSEQGKPEQSGVSVVADPVSDAVWLVDIRKRLSKDLRREVRNCWQVARQGGLRHLQRVRQVPLRVLIPVLLLIVCVLLSATSAWWFLYATNGVSVYRVEAMKPVDRDVGGGGVIYPRQQFDISYPMAERVIDVLVKAGDRVKVDQPLIKLDPVQVKAQLQLAASDVQAARSYLYSVSNIANAVVVAQAEQSYRIAQNRYNAVTAQNANFHNGILSASMEGVVTAVNINPGETAAPNAIMLTIMDQSVIVVRAQVPLDYLSVVHVGNPAFVIPSSMPDASFGGTVSAVIPRADPQTDTFEAQVTVPNGQQRILPGMGAFVRIQFKGNAYILPKAAVHDTDHDTTVFVAQDGHLVSRSVHVVGRSSSSVYVDHGIAAGERVVVAARNAPHDGQFLGMIPFVS